MRRRKAKVISGYVFTFSDGYTNNHSTNHTDRPVHRDVDEQSTRL